MKKIYNQVMYIAIFLACYCSYCKIVMITVNIYSFSNSVLLIIISIGITVSIFIVLLIRRLFRYFEDPKNLE